MTRLPRTLKQVARIWFETSPEESAFFQNEIEQAEQKWKAIEAARSANPSAAKAKKEASK